MACVNRRRVGARSEVAAYNAIVCTDRQQLGIAYTKLAAMCGPKRALASQFAYRISLVAEERVLQ
jgi:hypothetical protein